VGAVELEVQLLLSLGIPSRDWLMFPLIGHYQLGSTGQYLAFITVGYHMRRRAFSISSALFQYLREDLFRCNFALAFSAFSIINISLLSETMTES
jgi:hypothetical protein